MGSIWITVGVVAALPLAFVVLPVIADYAGRRRRQRAALAIARPAAPPPASA